MLEHIQRHRNLLQQGYDTSLEIIKSEEHNELMKGKPTQPIGTKKEMGGRMYIKTANGWKYFGSGGGAKAQEHHGAAGGHNEKPKVGVGSKISNQEGHNGHVVAEKDNKVKIKHTDPDGNVSTHVMPKEHLQSQVENGKVQHQEGGEDDTDTNVNINERFQAFGRFVRGVIKGRMKSMIAYGSGGVGKTYTVTQELKAAGKKEFNEEDMSPGDDNYDYVKITGYMSAPEVYKTMYEHNGKILLFDDCDKVLRDSASINLFKGALDTSGDGTISYGTKGGVKDDDGEKLAKRFKFTGRAMFISNLPANEIPQPIKSRGYRVDLTMSPSQTIERMRHIAADKSGKMTNLKFPGVDDYTHEDMVGILDFLDKHKYATGDLNVRTVGALLGIKQEAEHDGVDWKKDAEHMLFSKGEDSSPLSQYHNLAAQRHAAVAAANGKIRKGIKIEKSELVTSGLFHGSLGGDNI